MKPPPPPPPSPEWGVIIPAAPSQIGKYASFGKHVDLISDFLLRTLDHDL